MGLHEGVPEDLFTDLGVAQEDEESERYRERRAEPEAEYGEAAEPDRADQHRAGTAEVAGPAAGEGAEQCAQRRSGVEQADRGGAAPQHGVGELVDEHLGGGEQELREAEEQQRADDPVVEREAGPGAD